jgi:hypothetical protein
MEERSRSHPSDLLRAVINLVSAFMQAPRGGAVSVPDLLEQVQKQLNNDEVHMPPSNPKQE